MAIFEKLTDLAATLFLNPVYQPFSFALLFLIIFLFTYEKVKSMGLFSDITSLFRTKKNQLKILNERVDSDLYTEQEKQVFRHEIKVIEYQILLKTKVNHLQTLIHFNTFLSPISALKKFSNCSHLVKFNDNENILYSEKPISSKKAGLFLFLGMVFWIGFIFFGMWFIKSFLGKHQPPADYIVIYALLLITIFVGFTFIGYVYFKMFAAFNDAYLLLKMARKKIEPVSEPENKNEA
ncbi:hypothetical protein [Acinetobacter sp. A47]|uniref:hypothetical protein n=1 Tax=Acinetobacter sp. A47 TaxID=1561217 RepID=UPI0005713158|nr:hypothetical protein [Acinetobacter sp. A47]